MPKKSTIHTAQSREAAGRVRRSFNLPPERDAQLQRLTERYGTMQAALEAALDALDGRNDPSNAELLAMISRRLGA